MGDEKPTVIWQEQRPAYTVEVRSDGKVLVQVPEPLDDNAARDLAHTLHHAANAAETIRRPRQDDDGQAEG
jgi:hypothetical protein